MRSSVATNKLYRLKSTSQNNTIRMVPEGTLTMNPERSDYNAGL